MVNRFISRSSPLYGADATELSATSSSRPRSLDRELDCSSTPRHMGYQPKHGGGTSCASTAPASPEAGT